MKKMNMITGMLFAAAVLSTGAYAASTNTTAANTTNQQAFFAQTTTLRANLAADSAELEALLHSNTPDTSRIRTLSENITTERDTLRQQAIKFNVAQMGYGGMMTAGEGCGYGGGMMGSGFHGNMHGSMMDGTDGGYHHMEGYGDHHM